jgi:three-Cys-motif partner protein
VRYTAAHNESIGFTDCVFINNELNDYSTLNQRIAAEITNGRSKVQADRIQQIYGDANDHLPGVMTKIALRDYIFAFVDITGTEHWPFSSVREFKRHGHNHVDFYMLFPLEMALLRQLAYADEMTERYAPALTDFFDGEEWREIRRQWRRSSADSNQLKLKITELYLTKLRTVWKHADVQATLYRSDKSPLYKMIFAADHVTAKGLAAFQKRSNQRGLFDD